MHPAVGDMGKPNGATTEPGMKGESLLSDSTRSLVGKRSEFRGFIEPDALELRVVNPAFNGTTSTDCGLELGLDNSPYFGTRKRGECLGFIEPDALELSVLDPDDAPAPNFNITRCAGQAHHHQGLVGDN